MKIVDVQPMLAEHRGSDPLQMKRLGALEPVPVQYSALLCQPHGTIRASATRIGNSDSQSIVPMYRAFLRDAVDSQAQLAVTPEYSVPWSLIRDVALAPGASRPPHGSLWALGCESITPDELDALQVAVTGQAGVRLIYETFDPQRRAQTAFVDPLVFVFWAIDGQGADVLCVLVQFKTVVSRDPDHVELKFLYPGTCVYKFTTQPGGVSLLALICSDAFDFTDALIADHGANLLLLHVQLNKRPAHIDYAAYRTRLFSVASNNNVEIICLNWAANVSVEGTAKPWNAISGSAWYIAPRGLAPTDADVNQLHRDGMYYSIAAYRWHAFYLNYSPHSVLLRKQPVFAAGPQVLATRLPPHVVARRAWNSLQDAWTAVPAADGFNDFIQGYAPLPTILPQLCENDPLAVERALELLEGPQGLVSDWYALKELRALRVADEESLCRVTVSQETDATRQGVVFRRRRVRCAQTASTIPGQPLSWPAPVKDLAAGFRYRWTAAAPHCNVEPLEGGSPAAFIYLGEDPEADTLANVYAKVSKARRGHAFLAAVRVDVDPSDAVSLAQDRLCVVYKDNHALRFYRPPGYASITDSTKAEADDIAGDQE